MKYSWIFGKLFLEIKTNTKICKVEIYKKYQLEFFHMTIWYFHIVTFVFVLNLCLFELILSLSNKLIPYINSNRIFSKIKINKNKSIVYLDEIFVINRNNWLPISSSGQVSTIVQSISIVFFFLLRISHKSITRRFISTIIS